jgi:hypothetical protein
VKKNKIVTRLEVGTSAIFDIDWGLFGIVAGSENGSL